MKRNDVYHNIALSGTEEEYATGNRYFSILTLLQLAFLDDSFELVSLGLKDKKHHVVQIIMKYDSFPVCRRACNTLQRMLDSLSEYPSYWETPDTDDMSSLQFNENYDKANNSVIIEYFIDDSTR